MNPVRLGVFAVAMLVSVVASASTEPNSFLIYPAPNHAALMRQARTEPVLMKRFMRHFGIGREEVLTMLEGLKLGRLEEDGMYLIYNVPESEELRSRVIFYRKGTLVWVNQSGQPVLKASCANPMVRGTDIALAYVAPPKVNMTSSMAMRDFEAVTPPETAMVLNPMSTIEPTVIETGAQALLPQPPEIPLVSNQPIAAPWWILPAAGAFFIRTGDDPPPIPEPGTIIAFGAGAAALAARRKARSKK